MVWANSTQHRYALTRELPAARRPWLTLFRPPPGAPDLNPAEGMWANLKIYLGNLAASTMSPASSAARGAVTVPMMGSHLGAHHGALAPRERDSVGCHLAVEPGRRGRRRRR